MDLKIPIVTRRRPLRRQFVVELVAGQFEFTIEIRQIPAVGRIWAGDPNSLQDVPNDNARLPQF